jgi:hypothetical protein
MPIRVYDQWRDWQGWYDRSTSRLELNNGGFKGELFDENRTRLRVVDYDGRFTLDSVSSGSTDFGNVFAGLGAIGVIFGFVFGPMIAAGSLTGALLNRNIRDIVKWGLICSGILFAFWLSYYLSSDPDSMFAMLGKTVFFVIAFMCFGSTFAFQGYIDSKFERRNRFLKWLVRTSLGGVWLVVLLVITESIFGVIPIYLAHPSWIDTNGSRLLSLLEEMISVGAK